MNGEKRFVPLKHASAQVHIHFRRTHYCQKALLIFNINANANAEHILQTQAGNVTPNQMILANERVI